MQELNNKQIIRFVFIAIVGALTAFNGFQSTTKLVSLYPRQHPKSAAFAGKKFEGIQKILAGNKYIAYYTDQNLDNPGPLMELQQAQYTLAPVILDPDSLDHRFILINCVDVSKAIARMKEIGAKPLTANNMGIILAERPQVTP
ncbi:MAG: hypothetical protein HQL17_02365 [Candidatus Omnitrophica bacterium]|nr:hypothetical protein [Candidatus Omnitrophota bacterium]